MLRTRWPRARVSIGIAIGIGMSVARGKCRTDPEGEEHGVGRLQRLSKLLS